MSRIVSLDSRVDWPDSHPSSYKLYMLPFRLCRVPLSSLYGMAGRNGCSALLCTLPLQRALCLIFGTTGSLLQRNLESLAAVVKLNYFQ